MSVNVVKYTDKDLEDLLHNTHAMRIDIMRWFVPVDKVVHVAHTLHRTLDSESIKSMTSGVSPDTSRRVYLEQLYSAMAETFNILHAQIPSDNKTSDYGVTKMLPPL